MVRATTSTDGWMGATTTSSSVSNMRAMRDVAALASSPGPSSRRLAAAVKRSEDEEEDEEESFESEDEFTFRVVGNNESGGYEKSTRVGMSEAIARAREAAREAFRAAEALERGLPIEKMSMTPPHLTTSPTRVTHANESPGTRRARSPLGPPRRVPMTRPPALDIPSRKASANAAKQVIDSARSMQRLSSSGAKTSSRKVFWDVTRDHDRASAARKPSDRILSRAAPRDSDETTLQKLLRIAALAKKDTRRNQKASDVKEAVNYLASPQKHRAAPFALHPRL
jgi:hypothetical protein